MVKGNQKKTKQLFQSLASVMLALSVLIQFSFVSVNTMSCLKSGNQKVSVGEFDGCCTSDISLEEILQTKCCKYENSAKSFHSFHQVENNLSDQLQVAGLNPVVESVPAIFKKADVQVNVLANPPPKLFGRQLLLHISKFTI